MEHSSEGSGEPKTLGRRRRRALERALAKAKNPGSATGTAEKALISGAALAIAGFGFGAPANAATFNVTNLNDSGAGSLRQAIVDANGAAGPDAITFQAGLTGTISLTTGQLEVTDSVDIQGPGAAVISVSGNNASRVFYLYNETALIDVTISGLTVTQGAANIGAGIVDFDENLTLDHVAITNNHATNDGGGLWMDGFTFAATIRDSTISGNTATSTGGGVYNEDTGGALLFQRTQITGNTAGNNGGGVYFYDPDHEVTFEDSTISGNTASNNGGGMFVYDTDGGPFTLSRTTISGNTAANRGGGAYFYGPDDPVVIENSTISGNQATAGVGGGLFLYNLYAGVTIRSSTIANNSAAGSGGGIYLYSGTATLVDTIVGDNGAIASGRGIARPAGTKGGGALVANDIATGEGGEIDASYSLVTALATANFNDNGGNILNQLPQLGPLQNNGGLTQTQKPAATSPAVNAGDPAFTPPPTTDQRAFARVVNGRVDMGAVEINAGTVQIAASAVSVNENAGTVTITVTRTGGSDGAVSVNYATSDGTATAPADYAAASGTVNFADGDSVAKTFQVTIVNDTLDEPDETFNVTLAAPTGATLGSPATEVVTILDDDVAGPPPVPVPTLGDLGKILLAGLLGGGGLLLMRRRRGLTAPVVALTLTLGGVQAADARAVKPAKEVKAGAIQQTEIQGASVTLRLADGTAFTVPVGAVEIKDRRHPHNHGRPTAAPGVATLPAGQPVVIRIKHASDGSIERVKLQLFDTQQAAQAELAHDRH